MSICFGTMSIIFDIVLKRCSDRKPMVHFDPLILGWVSATQPTLHCRSSAQNEHLKSSYLFDNLKVKVGWTLCVQPTKGYNRNGAGRRDPHQDQVATFAPWKKSDLLVTADRSFVYHLVFFDLLFILHSIIGCLSICLRTFQTKILIKHKRPDFYSRSFNTYVMMVWARCAQSKDVVHISCLLAAN